MKVLRLIAWKAMARFPHRTQVAKLISDPLQQLLEEVQFLKGFSWGFGSNLQRNISPMCTMSCKAAFPLMPRLLPRLILKACRLDWALSDSRLRI